MLHEIFVYFVAEDSGNASKQPVLWKPISRTVVFFFLSSTFVRVKTLATADRAVGQADVT